MEYMKIRNFYQTPSVMTSATRKQTFHQDVAISQMENGGGGSGGGQSQWVEMRSVVASL